MGVTLKSEEVGVIRTIVACSKCSEQLVKDNMPYQDKITGMPLYVYRCKNETCELLNESYTMTKMFPEVTFLTKKEIEEIGFPQEKVLIPDDDKDKKQEKKSSIILTT